MTPEEILFNSTELVTSNNECVILKILPEKSFDLITTGCFNGDETMIRVARTMSTLTFTEWTVEKHWSWSWNTLTTDAVTMRQRVIRNCIKNYYKINL